MSGVLAQTTSRCNEVGSCYAIYPITKCTSSQLNQFISASISWKSARPINALFHADTVLTYPNRVKTMITPYCGCPTIVTLIYTAVICLWGQNLWFWNYFRLVAICIVYVYAWFSYTMSSAHIIWPKWQCGADDTSVIYLYQYLPIPPSVVYLPILPHSPQCFISLPIPPNSPQCCISTSTLPTPPSVVYLYQYLPTPLVSYTSTNNYPLLWCHILPPLPTQPLVSYTSTFALPQGVVLHNPHTQCRHHVMSQSILRILTSKNIL